MTYGKPRAQGDGNLQPELLSGWQQSSNVVCVGAQRELSVRAQSLSETGSLSDTVT